MKRIILRLLPLMMAVSTSKARATSAHSHHHHFLRRSSSAVQASHSSVAGGTQTGQNASNAIQRIYNSLASIPASSFLEAVQHPNECPQIQACLAHLDDVTLADLGLSTEKLTRLKQPLCMHVHESPTFDLAVFLLPAGKSLPLHDHPGMAVLSKVVHGSLRVSAYSKIETLQNGHGKPESSGLPPSKRLRLSEAMLSSTVIAAPVVVTPVILEASKTPQDGAWLLTPTEGNIHQLAAESTCVVFDVLLPPYDPPGRDCHYYTLQGPTGKGAPQTIVECAGVSDEDAVFGTRYCGYVPKVGK